jgi:hypothetical protein
MGAREIDVLSRYLRFSNEGATIINRALSAVRGDIERAFADDPSGRDELGRINDLQLFLMQVIAFDGFITRCMHAVGLEGKARSPLVKRVDLLASKEVREGDRYKALRSAIKEIVRVRNAWAHRLCDEEISENVQELADRFGLCERDGYLWITLEHMSADGGEVWGFVVCTLHEMAELIWRCVQERLAKGRGST